MPNPLIAQYGETVTVQRGGAAGVYDQTTGRYSGGAGSTLQVVAAVLPAGLNDLQTDIAAAGQEMRDAVVMYTDDELMAADELTRRVPDIVTHRGRNYVVQSASHRDQVAGLAHWRSVAFLQGS